MAGERIDTEGTEQGGELPPERLAEMLEADEVELIDVRRPHEWEAGRIPRARWVEVNDLPAAAKDLDHERPVVLYCRSGSRSELAAEALRSGGFDVHRISRWNLGLGAGGAPARPRGRLRGRIGRGSGRSRGPPQKYLNLCQV